MRAIEFVQCLDPRIRKIAGLKIAPPFELCILVSLTEVSFDAAIGKSPKLRSSIGGLDVAEVVTNNPEHLLHVVQAKVLHDHPVYFGCGFVFDGNAVVAAALIGTDDAFTRVHFTRLLCINRF
jgi:hypothetical protein